MRNVDIRKFLYVNVVLSSGTKYVLGGFERKAKEFSSIGDEDRGGYSTRQHRPQCSSTVLEYIVPL